MSKVRGILSEDTVSVNFARKGVQVSLQRVGYNGAGFHLRHYATCLTLRSGKCSAMVLVAATRVGLGDILPAELTISH